MADRFLISLVACASIGTTYGADNTPLWFSAFETDCMSVGEPPNDRYVLFSVVRVLCTETDCWMAIVPPAKVYIPQANISGVVPYDVVPDHKVEPS